MKKILFLTGTRADFGKLKSLISKVEGDQAFTSHLFVTGMHLLSKYGMTVVEIEKCGFKSIYKYINHNASDSMDIILSKTIHGLSDYIKELKPDLIVVHGDRVEALAGAIVGSLNNILVAHIEGGEVSGTIDELIRHAVTKMAHLHFVSNEEAKARLIQLGEIPDCIFIIGSPDMDIMNSEKLPTIQETKQRYEIPFDDYAILMHHPVTTELDQLPNNIDELIAAVDESNINYIVIYPNNDEGSEVILKKFKKLEGNKRFRIFPSIRFECFLTLMKNASFIIGNSSAGVREAPFFGIPSIDVGSRQNGRASSNSILNCVAIKANILKSIDDMNGKKFTSCEYFGVGKSDELFFDILTKDDFWKTSRQKYFRDL